MRTRSPLRNSRFGSTRNARPFESRLNNVSPMPRRGTLTGRGSGVFAVVPVEALESVEPLEAPLVFSGDLAGVAVGRGRFLGGLVVELDAGLSFGREVRNAPRTSSPSCNGTATPSAAQIKTNPKRIALNRITKSPLHGPTGANCAEYGCQRRSDCRSGQAAL